jgi:uncharacterized protein
MPAPALTALPTQSFGQHYRAPAWLPGGNLQTIWAATLSRRHLGAAPAFVRERWATPDADFIDVDHLRHPACVPANAPQNAPQNAPLNAPQNAPQNAPPNPGTQAGPKRHLVLFHGLEGSSASQYALAFACIAQQRGWDYSVPHFRGCSGELNLAPRAYHSGDFEEIGWILRRLRERSATPLLVVGISLGGNALLRWAQESGGSAANTAAAVAAVSSPIDMKAAGQAVDSGFNWLVYSRMFLRTMKPRAMAKLQQHPGLFDGDKLQAARTLYEFDDVFTAPLHGFRNTPDYWARASAKPRLSEIRIPALVLNARNDPFVPAASLPDTSNVGPNVKLWQPAHGGHVGFPQGGPPGNVFAMPLAVADWLASCV